MRMINKHLDKLLLSTGGSFMIFGMLLPKVWCYALVGIVVAMVAIIVINNAHANKIAKSGKAKNGATPMAVRRRGVLYALCLGVLFAAVSVAYFSDVIDINLERSADIRQVVSDSSLSTEQRADAIVAQMSVEEKAAQLIQDEYTSSWSASSLLTYPLGSVFSGGGNLQEAAESAEHWQERIGSYQEVILKKSAPIPIIYGIDAVHGLGKMRGAVVFPHNIGIGAANDPVLTYEMGKAVAEEMKLAGIRLNFAPCVAISGDPRWGRTYECYSSEESIVTSLGTAFAEGQLDAGVMPTAKHFVCDGNTGFGSGYSQNGTPLDRGNARITEEQLREIYLKPYEALIDSGVKAIMASFSSLNGVMMHENKYLLTDILKGELGYEGFVVSDYLAIDLLSGDGLEENVALAINAGVDMLMQPYVANEAVQAIVSNVEKGVITEERLDDAVRRILMVKIELGLFDDPWQKRVPHEIEAVGSEEYRELAKTLVEKSLVLLKNNGRVLPLNSGAKVFVTGDALDDLGVQCGGWTGAWQGQTEAESPSCIVGTSILDGLNEYATKYNLEIITDEARIDEADVVIIAIGEKPYAEWYGDTTNMTLSGELGLSGNKAAIELAERSGKPTVALIVSGRPLILTEQLNKWDAAVMCWLPGTEGDGVAAVLCGETDFSGKMPMPMYYSEEEIGKQAPTLLYRTGHGLNYGWNTTM